MENITEWAGRIDKNVRNKPNKQLQEELFNRVTTALKEGTNTYDECVAAFCRFDAKVIPTFYQDYYWLDIPDTSKWDAAVLSWANSKKPTVPATIRMALILQEKLKKVASSTEVLDELKWFSLNEDDRTVSAIKNVREKSKYSDLRKLLDLDMREWKIGQALIIKMYSILFSDALESKTQELYHEFKFRHGIKDQTDTGANEAPTPQPVASTGNAVEGNKELDAVPGAVEAQGGDKPAESAQPVTPLQIPPQTEYPIDTPVPKTADKPKDGIALAEAMLAWTRSQTARMIEIGTQLSNSTAEVARLNKQNAEMRERILELEMSLSSVKKDRASLEQQLQQANETSAILEAEKNAAQDTIGRVQIMSDNSVKQEIDGFKHSLGSVLSRTVKDFSSDVSDLTDAEKVEVYTALMEELLDTLKHNGIVIEEN